MATRAENRVTRPVVVWRFADGLRGHENQTDGLIEALAARTAVESHTLPTPRAARLGALWQTLRGGGGVRELPDPDLLVGAGRATHLPLLAGRLVRGGRAVVLMDPGLPRRLFDLLIVPEHDGMAPGPGVLVTRGALNRIRPADERDQGEGLILVGGPSRHYGWDDRTLCAQIDTVTARDPGRRWLVASSRRTPEGFLARFRDLARDNIETVDFKVMAADWLPRKLSRATRVWVSEDSVSMVFEALTAGAATGLLTMPRVGRDAVRGRGVAGSIDGLLSDGLVTGFAEWQAGRELQAPGRRLDEAGRCAEWIIEEWLSRTD